jgi:pyrroloquinoline quinone biosynthesis protein D
MSTALRLSSHPGLSPHVRLAFDRVRERHVLLRPESVLVLNPTGAAILELCDGRRTVAEIVRELGQRYDRVVSGEVQDFLTRLVANRYMEIGDD